MDHLDRDLQATLIEDMRTYLVSEREIEAFEKVCNNPVGALLLMSINSKLVAASYAYGGMFPGEDTQSMIEFYSAFSAMVSGSIGALEADLKDERNQILD